MVVIVFMCSGVTVNVTKSMGVGKCSPWRPGEHGVLWESEFLADSSVGLIVD